MVSAIYIVLPGGRVRVRHALLGGAVLTETIFSWPGIGRWLVDAIYRRDYAVLQGGVLLVSLIVMAVNLAVDLLYGAIDPRIRHPRG
jgi:dipeptide transport system permease protein